MLDAGIENVFHVGTTWVRDDGAIAERARSPFHASLKPSHNIARSNLLGDSIQQWLAFQLAILQIGLLQFRLNSGVGEFRSEVGILHHVSARLL